MPETGVVAQITTHRKPTGGSSKTTGSAITGPVSSNLPGLALVLLGTVSAAAISSRIGPLSLLLAAVAIGVAIGNTSLASDKTQPGLTLAAKRILRIGIVLLGLRLSLFDVGALGSRGVIVVVATVATTFFGVQVIGRKLGLSPAFSLLIATGYSICGASAIAAVEGSSDADEEEVAAAIGLVTLFGSLAILVLPLLAHPLGLSVNQFGTWAGASVHDVAQVIATASNYQSVGHSSARYDSGNEVDTASSGQVGVAAVVAVATVVKLTRIILLAPIVAGININRRRAFSLKERSSKPLSQLPAQSDVSEAVLAREGSARQPNHLPPFLPLFVAGFLAMSILRTTGLLSADVISLARSVEAWVLAAALVGLGSGVRLSRLRRLGPQPLLVGLLAWLLVAGVSYASIIVLL